MRVIINPGTEPCVDATQSAAKSNMRVFADEVSTAIEKGDRTREGTGTKPTLRFRYQRSRNYGNGRYAFLLFGPPRARDDDPRCEVQMPGVSLATLRDEGTPWAPRLYIDGNSWYWGFAVSVAADGLVSGPDEEDS